MSKILNETEIQAKFLEHFEMPLDWQKTLSLNEIVNIQNICQKAMILWGYKPITDFDKGLMNIVEPLNKLPLFLK